MTQILRELGSNPDTTTMICAFKRALIGLLPGEYWEVMSSWSVGRIVLKPK